MNTVSCKCTHYGSDLLSTQNNSISSTNAGLTRQPKWGHLKELHAAIKLCSTPLLQGVQTNFSIGQLQEV